MTSAISTSIQCWSKHNLLLYFLNWHSITPGGFGIFLKKPYGINIFSLLMQIIVLRKANVPAVSPLQNYNASTKEVSRWKQCKYF